MNPQLYDLVEFRWSLEKKAFIKVATHKTNVPAAIAYGEKTKIQALTPRSLSTRFRVVKNGALQYTNQFKPTKHEKHIPHD